MSTPISYVDVQVNDLIRLVTPDYAIEGRVVEMNEAALRFSGLGPFFTRVGELYLMHRPVPPIPNEPGTIIRDKQDGTFYEFRSFDQGQHAAWYTMDGRAWLPTITPSRDGFDVWVKE